MPHNIQSAVKRVTSLTAKEPFLLITLLLTVILSFFSRPHLSAVRWNVITTLFSLMLVCQAFDKCQLLRSLAGLAVGTFNTPRKLGFAMILTTGVLAMFMTNDVALLTVVPLTMIIAKVSDTDPYMLVILETVSANIFSALTPFGNPQNLYLYSYFKISPSEFFEVMIPFCLFGAVLLGLANLLFNKGKSYRVPDLKFEILDRRLLIGALAAFIINILSVLRIVDYRISFAATVLVFLFLAPKLIAKVDYFLLITFVLFFLFTDSITGIPFVKTFLGGMLNSKSAVLLLSVGLSQIISNVPAAVVISGFTAHYKELLYGVSAGGLGTLVASLASLISYKLYAHRYQSRRYLVVFTLLNFGILILLIAAILLTESL